MRLTYLLITIISISYSQPISWKQYFTFKVNEGLNFVIDTSTVVVNAGVPGINIANNGQLVLGWAGNTGGRRAGITYDSGKTFIQVSFIQPIQVDGGFIYFPDGRTRFVAEEPALNSTPQKHSSRIISWISNDGFNWTKEMGIRYQPGLADDSIASVCEVIQIKDSLWRMYYVGDWYRTNGIRTAISTNWGWTWVSESINNILRKGDVDPHPVYLEDGTCRLYFRSGMNKPPSQSGISCCNSIDGLYFDTTKILFLFADSTLPFMLKLDPMVIKYPNGKVACYFGASPYIGQNETPRILAAWSFVPTEINNSDLSKSCNFILNQNYPNPFNPTTRIRYSISSFQKVSLKIFDVLGNLIIVLVDDEKSSGIYEIIFDVRNFKKLEKISSGILFYQLSIGNKVQTKKMVFLQ